MTASSDRNLTLLYHDRGAQTDGIRDYTDCLQAALETRTGLHVCRRSSVAAGFTRAAPQDGAWLLQYNPFAYARWGFAPWLAAELLALRRRRRRPRIGLMVHEPFVPLKGVKWTAMGAWQRSQLWGLMQAADAVFVSIEAWAGRLSAWRPARPVHHLPVGSNLPDMRHSRHRERERLGVGDGDLIVSALANRHRSYLTEQLVSAVNDLCASGIRPTVLLLGANAPALPGLAAGAEVIRTGRLDPDELGARFAASDVFVAPLRDGVSTRRGTMMAALQHEVAVVGTDGPLTDSVLRDPGALTLAPVTRPDLLSANLRALATDAQRRRAVAAAGRALYESTFAWPTIADRMLNDLPGT